MWRTILTRLRQHRRMSCRWKLFIIAVFPITSVFYILYFQVMVQFIGLRKSMLCDFHVAGSKVQSIWSKAVNKY